MLFKKSVLMDKDVYDLIDKAKRGEPPLFNTTLGGTESFPEIDPGI